MDGVRSPAVTCPDASSPGRGHDLDAAHAGRVRRGAAAEAAAAPARFVCGDGQRALDVLGPWMTRGLPRAPAGPDDLTATLRFRPLQERYMPILRGRSNELMTEVTQLMNRSQVQDPELRAAP